VKSDTSAYRVVIVGGGFAGLYAARTLRGAPVQVTLVDRRNFHLFQPLLYQVATAGLSPGDIASPLRTVLKRQRNAEVLLAEVVHVDVLNQRVVFRDGDLPYDALVIATGASHAYFGHDEWEPLAPGLKTIEDALEIRRRILLAFEAAERETDPALRAAWLNFVVVGGGPTGVELAGTLGEIANRTLKGDFHHIDPADARIFLLEGADRVLPPYPPDLSRKARRSLEKLGVTVRTGTLVTNITAGDVTVRAGALVEHIPTHTVLWAAGVRASPLGKVLQAEAGAQLDRAGRVLVDPDLTIPGHPEIFVIGDLASYAHQGGKPLPGVAPVAIQEGDFVARLIRRRAEGGALPTFHYNDKGSLATIGRAAAVADIKGLHLSGFLAWLTWVFVHLLYIVEFENRVLIFMQWAWNYFTSNRGARLITGQDLLPTVSPMPSHLLPVEQGERANSPKT
jgi:NADH:ubiquinone reductase (H+-translocating)